MRISDWSSDVCSSDLAKHYMLSSYHQASECFEFLFNAAFFDDLPEDLQAILKYGVEATSTSNTALALNYYSADLQTLQKEHGVTVHRTSKAILDAQLAAWDKTIPDRKSDVSGKVGQVRVKLGG